MKNEKTSKDKTKTAKLNDINDGDVVNNGSKKESDELGKCACSSRCRFQYAFFATILVLICAVAEHYYNRCSYKKFSESNKIETKHTIEKNYLDQLKKIDELEKKIEYLQRDVSKLSSLKKFVESHDIGQNQVDFRKKWKTWIALMSKLQQNEPFCEELNDFNKVFSGDSEVLEMVKSITNEAICVAPSSCAHGKVVTTFKKYLSKIIRVKKINHRKLYEISGYILSNAKTTAL